MQKAALLSLAVLLCATPVRADRETPLSVAAISSEDIRGGSSISDLLNELPRHELGVNVFYQDVQALVPGGGGTFSSGVIGIGANYTNRPNPTSPLYLRGTIGWGVGSEKIEDLSVTLDGNYKTLYGSAAGGVILPITKRGAVYGQGGLFYSSTTGTFDNGTTEFDGEPFNVFGFDTALGLRYRVGEKNSLFMEQYSQFGWGSGEDNDVKYNATVKFGCFRGGYNFGF